MNSPEIFRFQYRKYSILFFLFHKLQSTAFIYLYIIFCYVFLENSVKIWIKCIVSFYGYSFKPKAICRLVTKLSGLLQNNMTIFNILYKTLQNTAKESCLQLEKKLNTIRLNSIQVKKVIQSTIGKEQFLKFLKVLEHSRNFWIFQKLRECSTTFQIVQEVKSVSIHFKNSLNFEYNPKKLLNFQKVRESFQIFQKIRWGFRTCQKLFEFSRRFRTFQIF